MEIMEGAAGNGPFLKSEGPSHFLHPPSHDEPARARVKWTEGVRNLKVCSRHPRGLPVPPHPRRTINVLCGILTFETLRFYIVFLTAFLCARWLSIFL